VTLEEQVEGAVYHRVVGDRVIMVWPMLMGKYRLYYADIGSMFMLDGW
jgi:hypothetical protein